MKENKNNVTANQAEVNTDASTENKEEAVMNNTATENVNVQQDQIPAEQSNDQVPVVAEPEQKETFWAKAKRVGKKVAKGAGVALLVVGGVLVGEKIGEAIGFDKATDNYDKLSKSGDSSSDDDDEDDEEDEIDGGDYTEVES